MGEPFIESWSIRGWQRVPLMEPCDRMREAADPKREVERRTMTWPPRLQVGVTEPREPGIVGREPVHLDEESEGLEQRDERVADRRIAPVEHAEPAVPD